MELLKYLPRPRLEGCKEASAAILGNWKKLKNHLEVIMASACTSTHKHTSANM